MFSVGDLVTANPGAPYSITTSALRFPLKIVRTARASGELFVKVDDREPHHGGETFWVEAGYFDYYGPVNEKQILKELNSNLLSDLLEPLNYKPKHSPDFSYDFSFDSSGLRVGCQTLSQKDAVEIATRVLEAFGDNI